MKKKIVVYLAGLLTVLGLGFGQAQFADVPAGHWAREAVERIAAAGLITGFPDGTFRGDTNLTRYQAALIFHRLLTQLEERPVAIAPEDLVVIRNAVQEVAAELAALGVRVTALEDNAATRDDIARLEAAIEEVKKAIPEPGVDAAALADLADRVEAASVAADTALAQAQALAERLDAVEGDVAALETNVEANADSIRALNELAVLLNQDVLSLQDRVTAVEKRLGEIDFDAFAEREDVSAVQEFATALRADLVRLSDRVSALDTRVGAIDTRLTAVEGNRPTLTGSLAVRYGWRINTGAVPGLNFDVDRLFPGMGFAGGDVTAGDTVSQADTGITGALTFTVRRAPGVTAGFNFSDASVSLGGLFVGNVGDIQNTTTIHISGFAVNGNIDGQPVTMRFSNANTWRFTPYFMNNVASAVGQGVLVTASLTRAPLSPSVSVVLGSTAGGTTAASDDYFGIRNRVSLAGLNVGVNYAETNLVGGTAGHPRRSLVGLDYDGTLLGFLRLDGELIRSTRLADPLVDGDNPDTLFFTQAGFSLGPVALRLNYRAIDPAFATANWGGVTTVAAGLSRDATDRMFDPALAGTGFGVIGSIPLGFMTLNGYFDSKSDFFTLANAQSALGVGATLPLFAGFTLTGYWNSLTIGGTTTYAVASPYAAAHAPATRASFGNRFGVRLAHDGAAPAALIRGLGLALEYRGASGTRATDTPGAPTTDIVVEATYALPVGFLTLTPNFRYHGFTGAATALEPNHTTIKWGLQATTTPLFFGISLSGGFAQRSTDFATGTDAAETAIRAGLSVANFLLPGATLGVNVAQVTGTGVGAFALGDSNDIFTVTANRLFDGPSAAFGPMTPATGDGGVRGFLVTYTYAGWGIWLGQFDLDSDSTSFTTLEGINRSFRIFYTLSF
jgi:hypothetical protein